MAVTPALPAGPNWNNRVLSSDPLFCQPTLRRQVRQGDGDYLPLVKANQVTLREVNMLLIDPQRPCLPRR